MARFLLPIAIIMAHICRLSAENNDPKDLLHQHFDDSDRPARAGVGRAYGGDTFVDPSEHDDGEVVDLNREGDVNRPKLNVELEDHKGNMRTRPSKNNAGKIGEISTESPKRRSLGANDNIKTIADQAQDIASIETRRTREYISSPFGKTGVYHAGDADPGDDGSSNRLFTGKSGTAGTERSRYTDTDVALVGYPDLENFKNEHFFDGKYNGGDTFKLQEDKAKAMHASPEKVSDGGGYDFEFVGGRNGFMDSMSMSVPTAAPTRSGELPIDIEFPMFSQGLTADDIISGDNPIEFDLIEAMNELISEIVAEEFGYSVSNRNLSPPKGGVKFIAEPPTSIDNVLDIECPPDTSSDWNCQGVEATAWLLIKNVDPVYVEDRFLDAFYTAIADGRLNEKLYEINPYLFYCTSTGIPPNKEQGSNECIYSSGASGKGKGKYVDGIEATAYYGKGKGGKSSKGGRHAYYGKDSKGGRYGGKGGKSSKGYRRNRNRALQQNAQSDAIQEAVRKETDPHLHDVAAAIAAHQEKENNKRRQRRLKRKRKMNPQEKARQRRVAANAQR